MPRLKSTVASAEGAALEDAVTGKGDHSHLMDSTAAAVVKPVKAKKGGDLPFEATLWSAADQLRGVMDASEYKHVVLGLIFLKYISDAFEEKRAELVADPESDPEDRDEYTATNVFWVPADARWSEIAAKAKSPQIGETIDKAMISIEQANPSLRGVLPKEYAKPSLGSTRLGAVVDLINTIGLGTAEARQHDVIGRVYEYFLGRFANAEGKAGGEFYTPRSVVRLLVEMIEPFKGRVFDPAAGSGGMFVQSEEFVLAHGGKIGDLAIYGQESNHTTWRLAKMNLAIRGIEADIAWNRGGSFLEDAHPDIKADFILANPPFNESAWGGEGLRDDKRWSFGIPPVGNSNYAWIQHFAYHLAPTGVAAFIMANGSMSSNQSGEGEIRKALIEAENGGLVDCMIALPGQLFYTTQIPVCIWILARDRRNHKYRDRRNEILFIDARKMGQMTDRTHKELGYDDIKLIASTYHAWRMKDGRAFLNVAGFNRSETIDEVRKHGHVLTPGRYVGTEELEDDAEPFIYQLVIILTDDLLIVSVLVNSLLIIAFRGTRVENFKDWLRNLDLVQVSEKSISYHRGWFKVLVAHGRMLLDHVHKVRLGVSGLHVCVTGHSMGGAVAGILQSLCLSLKTKSSREQLAKLQESAISGFDKDDYRRMVNLMNHLRAPDAYTFGAPMFAFARNEEGEKYLAKAFHFRFPGDIVCAFPTRLLGYQFYGTSLDECALPQDFASLSDIIDQQHTIRRYYETLKAL